MYGIGGETDLTESTLDHLSGYGGAQSGAHRQRGVRPAAARRLGDAARLHRRAPAQRRADRLDVVWNGHRGPGRHRDRAVSRTRPRHLGDARRTEALRRVEGDVLGRGRPRSAHSPATATTPSAPSAGEKAADEIKAEVLDQGRDDRGVFRQHYDTDDLDASLLLIPIMGFLPPDDERVRATVLAIADELTQGRPRPALPGREHRRRALSGEEGTFTICSFWLVSALALIDEVERARAAVPEAAVVRRPAAPLRGGDRHHHRSAPGELPPGVHPPRADRRRQSAHRGRTSAGRDLRGHRLTRPTRCNLQPEGAWPQGELIRHERGLSSGSLKTSA